MLIDICMKFCDDSLSGFQVIEQTQFVTDTRTDPRAKKNMSPNAEGGDIIKQCKFLSEIYQLQPS